MQHLLANPGPLTEQVQAVFDKVAAGDYFDVLWVTRQAAL